MDSKEHSRLKQKGGNGSNWKKWGPYLSERQWGTVREDYSMDGFAWGFLPHDHARSKAYRWGEDGLAGICDDQQQLCFCLGLWNGKDTIIKERLFGLGNHEGNHGEDVKELYYYLDSTPTHSYMKMLYKYPQREFPYLTLVEENHRRTRKEPEFELWDTGIFDQDEYFDVFLEVAKNSPEDLLIQVNIHNRGNSTAPLTVIPQLWFRNTWRWNNKKNVPSLEEHGANCIKATHANLGSYYLYLDQVDQCWFTDNESNREKLYGHPNPSPYTKDAFHEYLIHHQTHTINPEKRGTKACGVYKNSVPPTSSLTFRFRLSKEELEHPFANYEAIMFTRFNECNEFYGQIQSGIKDEELKLIQRQAFAGLLWSKQYYYYNVREWINGDENNVKVYPNRKNGRNGKWLHIENQHIISMPDKWEYPWYAAWDLAFHCIPLARIDMDFAKEQLLLFLGEDYMHPNGQIPAYEWNFDDVNPPVHAIAVLRVYQIEKAKNRDKGDLDFLEKAYLKLLLNFQWWVNMKDLEGNNIFEGGFLGLDNIGIFDRSHPMPIVGNYEQSDGTGWMATYTLHMLRISIELAMEKPVYEDMAVKFFEHFLHIAGAMNNIGKEGKSLWSRKGGFFFDLMHLENGPSVRIKVRSVVGLIPLFAIETLKSEAYHKLPNFRKKLNKFLRSRPYLNSLVSRYSEPGQGHRRLLSVMQKYQLRALLEAMLDEEEFLSPYGIRSLSKIHLDQPYRFHLNEEMFEVKYLPGESDSGMFGGNSNWRGPIWFPINYMIIESLIRFHNYYGDTFKVAFPTGSTNQLNLLQVAEQLAERLISIFKRKEDGSRPVFGDHPLFKKQAHFANNILFYEYFHGDDAHGLGASHQTGWTGLVADLIHKFCKEGASY